MANVTLSQEDVNAAEAFLEAVLVEGIPDADLSRGSVLRDHVITALATVIGVMRGEGTRVRYATSFDTIGLLSDPADRLAAAQALAANWFVTPRAGTRVRGVVTLHFNARVSGRIPTTVVFAQTAGIRFKLDQASAYAFSTTDLLPNLSIDGQVEDYILRVPVIAEFVGSAYAVPAGIFAAVTPFNTAFTYAEAESAFTVATEPETAEELAARVGDAITVRDLNSARAIKAVIDDTFTDVTGVFVAGMGQAEQRRDVYNLAGAKTQLHLGANTDVYVNLPVASERVFQATVGAQYVDPRTPITAFADPTILDLRTVVSAGDVLHIYNALASEPRLYLIREVHKNFLRVQSRQPFPEERPIYAKGGTTYNTGIITAPATLKNVNAQFVADDVGKYVRITRSVAGNEGTYRILAVDAAASSVTLDAVGLISEATPDFDFEVYEHVVDYSIGSNDGAYDDKVLRRATGEFTRRVSTSGTIALPQEPIYLIRSVSVLNPGDPDADPISGAVDFPVRRNVAPTLAAGDQLQYQVSVDDPSYGHSAHQLSVLRLGWDPHAQGAQASLSATGVFTASSSVFAVSDVGATLRILNAFWPENRGEFVITSRISGTQVQLSNPRDSGWSPAPERRLRWELSFESRYDGFVCRVVYDTVASFGSVSAYIDDEDNRVACSSTLLRAYSPVYLSFNLRYKLRKNAEFSPSEEDMIRALVNFVNTYPPEDTINASDIVTAFHNTNPDLIGSVELPVTITYTLYAPDGRYIPYATQDAVTISATNSTAVTDDERLLDPITLGVSDNTVRYLTTQELVSVTQVP